MMVRLGDKPRIAETDVGGNFAASFFTSLCTPVSPHHNGVDSRGTYQTYSMPETVRSMSMFLQLARVQHGDPMLSAGISLTGASVTSRELKVRSIPPTCV